MVTVFNRKQLLVDISQIECNRVKQILKSRDIEYYLKTTRSQGFFSNRTDMQIQMGLGLSQQTGKANGSFVYRIYVKRKDHEQARKLAYGK